MGGFGYEEIPLELAKVLCKRWGVVDCVVVCCFVGLGCIEFLRGYNYEKITVISDRSR